MTGEGRPRPELGIRRPTGEVDMKIFGRARGVTSGLAVATLLAAGFSLSSGAPAATATGCHDALDAAVPFSLPVAGTTATGHYALPDGDPVGIVAFFHGYGHTSTSWREHLRRAAADLDVIAVAMDYRGTRVVSTNADGIETSRGWRVAEGAEETNVAVQQFAAACPTAAAGVITAFGVSMGGNSSGLAVAAGLSRPGGAPLYDWWVDVEGATDPIDTYLTARALEPALPVAGNAKVDIEEETGCPLEACPDRYRDILVIDKAGAMKAGGLKGVILVHGIDDGLVGPQHTRKMVAALRAEGIPYSAFTAGTRGSGESGTTLTGYAGGPLVPGYQSPLAGHASERSTTHLVMRTALDQLAALYPGGAGPTGFDEHVVDGEAGSLL